MDKKTIQELTAILAGIDKEISVLSEKVISTKAKAQIKNLQDKVDNRKKLPNFSIVLEVNGNDGIITVPLTLSDFLKNINVDATKEDKQALKNLEVRAIGLRACLPVNDEDKKE